MTEEGFTETAVNVGVLLEVMFTVAGPPSFVTVPSVAFTKNVSVPAELPAVNVTVLAVNELRVPRDGFDNDHWKVTPVGQLPPEQVGVTVRVAVPLTGIDEADEVTVTEESTTLVEDVRVTDALDVKCAPLRDTVTERVTGPATFPAVKLVVAALAGLTLPRELLTTQA